MVYRGRNSLNLGTLKAQGKQYKGHWKTEAGFCASEGTRCSKPGGERAGAAGLQEARADPMFISAYCLGSSF